MRDGRGLPSHCGVTISDFRTNSEYRRRHLGQLRHLIAEMLKLCQESGLLKAGRLALEGTKFKANTSRRRAMSDNRMRVEDQRLLD